MTKDKTSVYDPSQIEPKWRKFWEEKGLYKTDLKGAKKPFYNLMMYPYPSAEGLHVGNVYAFTGADIYGRFKKMQGYDVFEPIGFDSGGIHSENYAIKVGVHPKIQIPKNIAHFRQQLHMIGCMYDWDHTVDAMDPAYYRWTQWIFTTLFKAGLSYKKRAMVTWCPSCKTTLSDEQTEEKNGVRVCERCKTAVEKKELKQWFFKITDYAQRLLDNTYKLDWTEKVLLAQRNWIGKSEGAEIGFKTADLRFKIKVFTTRPDTLYGCTFMSVSPEYPKLDQLVPEKYKQKVQDYIKKAQTKSEMERKAEDKEKTGVFTGAYAVNLVNGEKLPIYVADYVLMEYGEGAVMGIPGHDERDFAFAKKYGLPIKTVVEPEEKHQAPICQLADKPQTNSKFKIQNSKTKEQSYEGPGILVNSGFWNGWRYPQDLAKIIKWLEAKDYGKKAVTYRLRDWCISRQRYWGPPIPMIWCPYCASRGESWFTTEEARKEKFVATRRLVLADQMKGWYPEANLPVLLPDTDDYLPGEAGGKPPLARLPEFVKVKCSRCGHQAQRETDVSDTFLDSSWYFLAYPNTGTEEYEGKNMAKWLNGQMARKKQYNHLTIQPFNHFITKKWLPVDQYTGGAEHSVLHLLYSRFITMALHDLGYLEFEEPFPHFYAHGLMIKDGAKMSKSRGNIVTPDEYIAKFGTDALRAYLMFMGPFSQGGDFRDTGMIGMYKFVRRLYQLAARTLDQKIKRSKDQKKILQVLHKTIKKVGEDYGLFKYNTAIASLMSFANVWQDNIESADTEIVKNVALVIAPLMPHLAEELWHLVNETIEQCHNESMSQSNNLKHNKLNNWIIEPLDHFLSVHLQPWPKYDPNLIKEDMVTIVVQVNGKVRDKLELKAENSKLKVEVEKLARQSARTQKFLAGKTIRNTIYVPGKLVNFVV